ncbi:MAG: hypothetical protein AAGI72_21550 [Pseudomonadota bacterium]
MIALLLFNLGVELAQLGVVLCALDITRVLTARKARYGFTPAFQAVGTSDSIWAGIRVADTFF